MHRMLNRTLGLATVTALIAGAGALLGVSPAQADVEKHARGKIGGGRYDISVEKDDGRFEVDAEIEGLRSRTTWRMVVRHEGRRVAVQTARAHRDDGRFEVDFRSVRRPNTPGRDTFKVTLRRVGGSASVTRTLVLR